MTMDKNFQNNVITASIQTHMENRTWQSRTPPKIKLG